MTAPEFSRPRRLDTLGEVETTVRIEADAAERARLAARLGLIAIEQLTADYALRRVAVGVAAHGTLSAAVVQACVATGDPIPAAIDEPFDIRFVPEPDATSGDEHELEAGELDTVFFEGAAIDLGEAAAETLALALDPYPRSPAAAAALRSAGVQDEDDARPAGALAGLKDLLERK